MDTLFSHVNIVTMNEQMTLWQDAFVGVTDGKIAYMAKKPPEEQPKKIIDATGMVLMPGLINCHTHLPMYLLRGYADDLNLQDWLEHYIFPREDRLDGRAVKAAATLAIAEALRFGTTSVSDMYYFCDEICQAVAESGIKANISRGTSMFLGDDFCFDTFPACQRARGAARTSGITMTTAALRSRPPSTPNIPRPISSGTRWRNTPSTTACSCRSICPRRRRSTTRAWRNTASRPRRCSTATMCSTCPTVAAHCVHVTQEDMQLLAKRHVSAAHCPVSNLKLASGCADVLGMVKAGMNVCLGTDSVASNNNLDLFEEIKAAALMAKGKTGDPKALPAEAALMMATVCGARAQGRSAECGVIELGMDADLILLDFNQPHLIPCHNVLSQLVYAASGHDVALTMVRGKILYADGKYPTLDIAGALKELHDYAIPRVFSDEPEAQA